MGRDRSEKRKRAGSAADRRRAQTYLAQLARLEHVDGSPGDIVLDGTEIAKARRAARTVMREHAEVLPELVGDVDRWWKILDAKLAWCSAGGSAAFDPAPFLAPRLARAVAAAGEIGRRAATAWLEQPEVLARVLAWIAPRSAQLAALPVDDPMLVALLLVRLVVLGEAGKPAAIRERGGDALLALLAVDAPDPIAALDVTRNLESRLLGHHDKRKVAPQRSGPRVITWLRALLSRDVASRHRALALLAEARIAEALEAWAAWEREHSAMIARAAELATNQFDKWDKAVHGTRVIKKLEAARSAAPVPVSINDVIAEIEMLSGVTFAPFHPAIVRLLATLPMAKPTTHAKMLLHCARVAACASSGDHVEWLWEALADALERGAAVAILDPWQPALSTDGRLWLEDDLVDAMPRKADVARVVRVMELIAAKRGTIDRDDAERAAMLLRAGVTDEDSLVEVVIGLRDLDEQIEVDVARAILALADDELERQGDVVTSGAGDATRMRVASIERHARLVVAVTKEQRYAEVRRFVALIEHAVKAGAGWLVRGLLEAGQGKALERPAEVLPYVAKSRVPPIVTERDAPWIARYPVALAPALRRLASVDPDAEAGAAKRLADDVPDPAALEREIAALRERAKTGAAGLAKRLANLEARLASPKPPSPKRLANLAAKLDRAACDIGIQRFRAALDTAAIARLVRSFGLVTWPEWGWEPRTFSTLFALLQLGEVDRELAGRLLRARCGEPPWDLRDDPVNRAFLDQMRRANVDPAPWLDGETRLVQAHDGKVLALQLCDDPLDVFEMGAHFQTCLSPDGGNFLSVVANAADINKRVLYARRDGTVVGRCLLALTDGFALLTFQAYCHDNAIGFPDIVRDFTLDLATRMRTTLVPRGSVRTLLARDWYDDGSRDLVGRFRGLDDAGLDFAAIDPATLVGVLRAALEREIDDVTLPIILGHPGVRDRPALIFPLAPFALASATPLTRLVAAQLAFEAGDRALADRLLGQHAGIVRLEHHVGAHGDLIAHLRPSYTLARLRETRARDVRSWADDMADRTALAGTALEALHRPKQAAAMYRLAMRESYMAPLMRARLRELGEPIAPEREAADDE